MKKILFLILLSVAMYGQVPADATPLENIQITNNQTSTTATKVNVQENDGTINTISKSDLVNVVEVNDVPSLPLIGEVGKIYVVKNVNKIYRWNGTFYPELTTDISGKEDINNISFQADKRFRAYQGVAADAQYIYVVTNIDEDATYNNIIQKYNHNGYLVAEKKLAYTGLDSGGLFMSFGSPYSEGDYLYIPVTNFGFGVSPYESKIIVFDKATLSVQSQNTVGSGVVTGICKFNNEFYLSYSDLAICKKYSTDYIFQQQYNLSVPVGARGGYQSLYNEGVNWYFNEHGSNTYSDDYVAGLDNYTFNGSSFTFIQRMETPTFGASQGSLPFQNKYYWIDRPANRVIITSRKSGRITEYIDPYFNNVFLYGQLTGKSANFSTNAVYNDSENLSNINFRNSSFPSKKMLMGYDGIEDGSFVQSGQTGAIWKKLMIQPNGGVTIIGSNIDNGSGATLQVSGAGTFGSSVTANKNLILNNSETLSSGQVINSIKSNVAASSWAEINTYSIPRLSDGQYFANAIRLGFLVPSDAQGNSPLFEAVSINQGGNVGIGVISPSAKLDVAGTFNATGAATFSSTVTASPATASNHVVVKSQLDAVATSGSYTPSLSDFANTSARNLVKATYSKIGDIVTVFIHLTVDVITANTDTVVTVSLPINKVNTSLYELGVGVGRLSSVNTNEFTVRTSNVTSTNNIIRLAFKPVSSGTNIVSASFSYAIN